MKKLLFSALCIFCACSRSHKAVEVSSEVIILVDTVKETTVTDSNVYWIPRNQKLANGLIHDITTNLQENIRFTWNNSVVTGTMYDLNFYGKKLKVIGVNNDTTNSRLGCVGTSGDIIIMNRKLLNEAYSITKDFLTACSLQDQIVSKEDFYEAIFMQELWHTFNLSLEEKTGEYFSEYPSLDSKAGNFYLAAKFVENNAAMYAKVYEPSRYKILRESYRKTFELYSPVTNSDQMVILFKNLLKKYSFDELIRRYKTFH